MKADNAFLMNEYPEEDKDKDRNPGWDLYEIVNTLFLLWYLETYVLHSVRNLIVISL